MAKSFEELSGAAKGRWTEDTHREYEAAVAEFSAEMSVHEQLGAQLSAARKARGLTQPALSALTGIQQAEISRIERGLGNPTAATLLRLADALGQRLTLTPA